MEIDPRLMAQARRAQREAIRRHLFDPNVSLIGIGLPEHDGEIVEDEIAVRIHVKQKLFGPQLVQAEAAGFTRRIPDFIDGFPIDVPEGRYRPSFGWGGFSNWNSPNGRFDPLRGGISISDEYHYAAGTLGCKVIDRRSGDEMILSNWHVLVADWGMRTGQRILQPGRLDGGRSTDVVATLTRDAMAANIDAAVATLAGNRPLINEQLNLGPLRGVSRATLGMTVKKSGRTSGVTFGRVTDVEGVSPPINYGPVSRMIYHIVTIDARSTWEQVSEPGDSGSCWMDSANRAIALHFAGSNQPERGLGIDMQMVLNALDVTLATSEAARQQFPAREMLSARTSPRPKEYVTQ